MNTLKISNIVWDTDGLESSEFPNVTYVTEDFLDGRDVTEFLADEYGELVESFDVEELSYAESLQVRHLTHFV